MSAVDADFIRSQVKVADTGCWEWQGSTAAAGRAYHKGQYAYRLSYEIFVGPIPDGLQINHHCDNPLCVNPEHIYAGTQKQNTADALARGRLVLPPVRRGGQHPHGHPDDLFAAVRAECAAGLLTKREIADRFGLPWATVNNWARGSRFGHDPIPMRDERLAERPPCGTRKGYCAHKKRGEPRCDPCWEANRQYMREYKAKRAALAVAA